MGMEVEVFVSSINDKKIKKKQETKRKTIDTRCQSWDTLSWQMRLRVFAHL